MTEKLIGRGNLLGADKKEETFTAFDIVIIVLIFILVACMLIQTYIFTPVKVEGSSMMQTLQNDDWLFMNKLKKPQRGDVVVFKYSANVNYIKRVIALPGDRIYSEDGCLYLVVKGSEESQKLVEDYAYYQEGKEQGTYKDINLTEIDVVVEEGKMYVLGDNRWGSKDSRDIGTVELSKVIGIVPNWSIKNKEKYASYFEFIENLNDWMRRTFKRN